MGKIICFVFLTVVANSAAAQSTERRCGWIDNPTPANWWIEDRDAAWLLFKQGDLSVSSNGFLDLPAAASRFGEEWVNLNDFNGYGYGCGCVEGQFLDGIAVSIEAMEPLPLARCEVDSALQQR